MPAGVVSSFFLVKKFIIEIITSQDQYKNVYRDNDPFVVKEVKLVSYNVLQIIL